MLTVADPQLPWIISLAGGEKIAAGPLLDDRAAAEWEAEYRSAEERTGARTDLGSATDQEVPHR